MVPEELRVHSWECNFGATRLVDRESHQFGQFHSRVIGVVLRYSITHHHHWVLGGHDQRNRLFDTVGIRTVGVVHLTRGNDIHLSLSLQGVSGETDIYRSLGMAVSLMKSTSQNRGDSVRQVQLH